MPKAACQQRITCECVDDPISNFSSEGADVIKYRSLGFFNGVPRLGWTWAQLGCVGLCESTVSQEDADDCARRQQQECVWKTWDIDFKHPVGCNPPCTSPPQAPTIFYNTAQMCSVTCPDGRTFTWTIAPGTIAALSQAEANAQAFSLACLRAGSHKICISTSSLEACKGVSYSKQLIATGGIGIPYPYIGVSASLVATCSSDPHRAAFTPIVYEWEIIAGSLPPGLTLKPCSGFIEGVPTTSGTFTFTVKVTDRAGSYQTKNLSFCVFEISTASLLPNGSIGTAYSQALAETPTASAETWSVLAGTLPPGLSLNASTGVISGTPTTAGTYNFTVQATLTCP